VIGEAGEYVVVARRKHKIWYLGGINNDARREIRVPFDFLGTGEYQARLLVDDSLSGDKPNTLRREERKMTTGSSLNVTMAPGGGFVAEIGPQPPNL
jgi:alpha-glucosidase